MSDVPAPEEPKGDADPASIGLFVYFVLLILTVAALLILPALL
jgi:hypothetical protein